jgi:hypothetical protein
MKKKFFLPIVIILTLITAYFIFATGSVKEGSELLITAKKGVFQIDITTSGELEAKFCKNSRAQCQGYRNVECKN